jgi:hypothetical protein
LEYYAAKLDRAQQIISKLSEREVRRLLGDALVIFRRKKVGPAESGILVPITRQPERNCSRHRITDGHGSATMMNLHGKRVHQRTDRETAADLKRKRSDDRATKNAEKNAEEAAKLAAWRACRLVCVCTENGDCSDQCLGKPLGGGLSHPDRTCFRTLETPSIT